MQPCGNAQYSPPIPGTSRLMLPSGRAVRPVAHSIPAWNMRGPDLLRGATVRFQHEPDLTCSRYAVASMRDVGIMDGGLVVVQPGNEARNGQIRRPAQATMSLAGACARPRYAAVLQTRIIRSSSSVFPVVLPSKRLAVA